MTRVGFRGLRPKAYVAEDNDVFGFWGSGSDALEEIHEGWLDSSNHLSSIFYSVIAPDATVKIDASSNHPGKGLAVIATNVNGNEVGIFRDIGNLRIEAPCRVCAAACEKSKVFRLVFIIELIAICAYVLQALLR